MTARILTDLGALSLIIALPLVFQNCGDPFQTAGLTQASSLESAPKPQPLNCENPLQPAATLSETCLYELEIAPPEGYTNLRLYVPQYPLYSDGATKRRWIYLPEGSTIDTSNPDEWKFPQGTILWKEFSMNGKRLETRQLEKTGTGNGAAEWRASVYVWRADQTDADLMTNTFTLDSTYEAFSYPSSYTLINTNQCNQCHQSSQDMALGFSYLQLSAESLNPSHLQLSQLKAGDWLSKPPTRVDSIKGDLKTQLALGFLHANCATCHSPNGSASFIGTLNLKHSSSATSPPTENAWASTVGVPLQNSTGIRIVAGDPDQSSIYVRTQAKTMPPNSLGLHTVDTAGAQALKTWIESL